MSWLVFPHQLFKSFLSLPKDTIFCLLEEPLFFWDESRSTTFAKIKLAYTRATMKSFEARLKEKGFTKIHYFSFNQLKDNQYESLLSKISPSFKYYDVSDNMLEEKLGRLTKVKLERVKDSPMFLYSQDELSEYLDGAKGNPFFQTSFYRHFRQKTGALMTKTGQYLGGKLSFDGENRSKIPASTKIPQSLATINKDIWGEAVEYVNANFPDNPGKLSSKTRFFAIDHEGAEAELEKFIKERLDNFGPYQDGFFDLRKNQLPNSATLFHSCISPYINNGLLSAQLVLDTVLQCAGKTKIQSLEGFVRQLMGWREFIRFVYIYKGEEMRKSNQLDNYKSLDDRWYDGTIGVPPVDDAIKFAFDYGYLHHILRLMVVANFMNLSRIHPHEMFRWFLDFSLDAYDWVMIGNVYGMATFASPIMSTKPYISGSNYILKMSDYQKGDWCPIWDALYYRYLDDGRKVFSKNPRMGLMMANLNKKSDRDKEALFGTANQFLSSLKNYKKHHLDK